VRGEAALFSPATGIVDAHALALSYQAEAEAHGATVLLATRAVELTVRRGLPQPYATHPRLDLYVGSLSPHPLAVFACTSCHEGQGSSTSFDFASHTPNDPDEAEDWIRDHGWFNNHHWIFPMYPERFAESACLKCHHEVTELGATDRFAEAPAPKVVQGHELAEQYEVSAERIRQLEQNAMKKLRTQLAA